MTAISGILQRAVRREDCEGLGADMLRIALRASRARSFLMPGDNADQANADEGTSAVLKRLFAPVGSNQLVLVAVTSAGKDPECTEARPPRRFPLQGSHATRTGAAPASSAETEPIFLAAG